MRYYLGCCRLQFSCRRLCQGCRSGRTDLRFTDHLRELHLPSVGQRKRSAYHRAPLQAAGVQDSKATNDKVAMGVGLVIFWPALLFTKGNDENTAELARLKGSMDAIEQVSIQKKCGITFQHAPPPAAPVAQNNGEYH